MLSESAGADVLAAGAAAGTGAGGGVVVFFGCGTVTTGDGLVAAG
jgi:hypothetical protein